MTQARISSISPNCLKSELLQSLILLLNAQRKPVFALTEIEFALLLLLSIRRSNVFLGETASINVTSHTKKTPFFLLRACYAISIPTFSKADHANKKCYPDIGTFVCISCLNI